MPNHTRLAIAAGAVCLAALYAASRQDPIPETPSHIPPSATIEQTIPKNRMWRNSAHRETWKRTLEKMVESHEEPENQPEPAPSRQPPDLYQLLKNTLESICNQTVKAIDQDYQPEDRKIGDLYVLNTGDSLTLRRVLDPKYPTVTDQVVLKVTAQDGEYLLESGEAFLDDEAKQQPYVVVYGPLEEIQSKLGAFIELQDTINAHDELAKQNQLNRPGWVVDNYRARFQAIQQVSWKYEIPIDPYAWTVLDNGIKSLEEQARKGQEQE